MEITSRVTDRLLDVAARDAVTSALDIADGLHRVLRGSSASNNGFEAALTSRDSDALAHPLFPPGPTQDELRSDKSTFIVDWERFYDSMSPADAADRESIVTVSKGG